MPTLYVENVPEDLYRAVRERARKNGNSMAAEIIDLLRENVPTAKELRRRNEIFERALRLRARRPVSSGPHLTAEEMQREDRER